MARSTSARSGRNGGIPSFVYITVVVCALGGLLFGYDTGVISGALLLLREDFGLDPFLEGLVVSSLLVGAMVGAIACGSLCDRFGRRRLALVAAVIFGVGPSARPSARTLPC